MFLMTCNDMYSCKTLPAAFKSLDLFLLKLFRSSTTKANFKWFCDSCLTNFELNRATALDERFSVIANQIKDMSKGFEQVVKLSKELQEVKNMISNSDKSSGSDIVIDNKGSWTDAKRVHRMKSSFVVKHKNDGASGSTIDVNRIKQIAVENSCK